MAATATADQVDVAALVREASRPAHEAAESRGFVTRLMGGELSLAEYVRYLAQYAWVYEALEGRTHQLGEPSLFDARLDRFGAMVHDLEALGAVDWRQEHPMLPATAAYVRHLQTVRNDDMRYLAHHYTRYLGDLSGGQAIAALVARHYGATPDQLSYYDFSELGSPVRYKEGYRAAMNELALSPAQIDDLVDEVSLSFAMNSAIFDALGQ